MQAMVIVVSKESYTTTDPMCYKDDPYLPIIILFSDFVCNFFTARFA